MTEPRMGDIVNFVYVEGEEACPAIITTLYPEGQAALTVFLRRSTSYLVVPRNETHHAEYTWHVRPPQHHTHGPVTINIAPGVTLPEALDAFCEQLSASLRARGL